jgi:hypothetical protein
MYGQDLPGTTILSSDNRRKKRQFGRLPQGEVQMQ